MGTSSSYVGMVSPDGQWLWDGTAWVPASPTVKPSATRNRNVIVGVLVLLAVVAGAALYSNHQRTDQAKREGQQQDHCINLIIAGTPSDELPSYCR